MQEKFQGHNRHLIITISPTSGSETTDYQKEDTPPQEYVAGNTVHYIFDNINNIQAVWYAENYTVLIDGDISQEEMKRFEIVTISLILTPPRTFRASAAAFLHLKAEVEIASEPVLM